MYKDHVRKLGNLRRREVFQFAPNGKKYWVSSTVGDSITYHSIGGIVPHRLLKRSAFRISVICHGC